MKVKRVFLLSLFVVLAANAWTLDLRAIAYRAFTYIGNSVPEKAKVDGNIGWLVDNKHGDYEEDWAFELNVNQKVRSAHYFVYDSNRNNLISILSDFEKQIYIQGYKFFGADEDCKIYVTSDGPFSMAIIIGNSIMTDKGRTRIQISFMRLADIQ